MTTEQEKADRRRERDALNRVQVAERKREWRKNNAEKNREQKRASRKRNSKWVLRRIVAWDGEGCNLGDEQLYVLLANSAGDYLVNRSGITTYQALNFLCDHNDPKAINVIFGGSYDANMILADLPRTNLGELWTTGSTRFAGFYIRYQWRKCFTVKRQNDAKAFVLWDVLGFFQKAFVDTVQDWLPDEDVAQMASMKAHRPDFDLRELDQIIAYCLDECRLLVKVCTALFDAFDVCDVVLNRYDGAGAAAAARMRKAGVIEHMGNYPPAVNLVSRYCYAGGRIEAVQTGNLDFGPVKMPDINSAYPSHIRNLPCLADGHGHWEYHDGPTDRSTDRPFTAYHVRWDYPRNRPFFPFFYRMHDGSVLFPRTGEGWCWKPEVDAAEKWDGDAYFDISESWSWVPSCQCPPPFDFVNDDYAMRNRFKEDPDPAVKNAQVVVKLWMNSLYGKMAQQLGYDDEAPKLHDLAMAGFVTSSTRAQMYDAGMQSPESVIAFATDAVIVTGDAPDLDYGNQLGQWGLQSFDGIVMVQAGVYFLRKEGEPWATDERGMLKESKFRGFDRGTLSREAITETWRKRGICDVVLETFHGDDADTDVLCGMPRNNHVHASVTRFVGAGSALASPEWYHRWRRWVTTPRKLSLVPAGKRRANPSASGMDYAEGLVRNLATPNLTPDLISAPYPLAWEDGKSTLIMDQIEGIDIRVAEREEWDSWA